MNEGYGIETKENLEVRISSCKSLEELVTAIRTLPQLQNSFGDSYDVDNLADYLDKFTHGVNLDKMAEELRNDTDLLDTFTEKWTRTYGIRKKVFELLGLKYDAE